MNQELKQKIRTLINTVYDVQKLRIQMGNRLVQAFNQQLGQSPGKRQNELDKESTKLIGKLRKEFTRITDQYVSKKDIIREIADNDEIVEIKNYQDYLLIQEYMRFLENEENLIKVLKGYVEIHPLWQQFLKDVKGCGTLMAAVIIAYFDPYKARHVSSFWAYCGIDTVKVPTDDHGGYKVEGRSKAHLIDVEYIDKDGNTATKKSITYNPIVKTKLVGVLGSSFLKLDRTYSKDNEGEFIYDPVLNKDGSIKMEKGEPVVKKRSVPGRWASVYYNYRNRLDNMPKHSEKTELHKHRMANRVMIKEFLREVWLKWREIESLPISAPYEVDKLGMAPHDYNNNHVLKSKEYPIIEEKAM